VSGIAHIHILLGVGPLYPNVVPFLLKGLKFLENVEQVTFSGQYAQEKQQNILYVTERAVFDLQDGQLRLIEIAPGLDLEEDILAWMAFRPLISDRLKEMDAAIFQEHWGQLKATMDNQEK